MNQCPEIFCEYPHRVCDSPATVDILGHWFCEDHKGWAEHELLISGAFITDGKS